MSIIVSVKKLHPDAIIPKYAHNGDAGLDLHSVEKVFLRPGKFQLISTGIAIAMPRDHVGLVHPRSGMAAKAGISIVNAPGTIDSGYRGEIKVNLINHGGHLVEIEKGDRIAQIVFQRYEVATLVESDDLSWSHRGSNGFGSTGA